MRNPQDFKLHASQAWKVMTNGKTKGELSQTAKTFLHEWYSGDDEEIHSKYLEKGNICELENIDFASNVLPYGLLMKNQKPAQEDDFFIGTCDVEISDRIIDVKSPWNNKTLQSNIYGMDTNYEWQGRVYMHLYKKENFTLFYGLLNTPEECNYDIEICFDHIPEDQRWIAYEIKHKQFLIDELIEKVRLCREYLMKYDDLVKSKIGKIITLG